MPISQMRKLSIEKGKATCSTSQLKSHTGSPGPQPEVPSMAPLPCMGSAVSMRFGALGMGGAELIGVNGIDVSGLETVSPSFTCPLPPFEPLLHLKEKHKSRQRGTKQRFMKRTKRGSKKSGRFSSKQQRALLSFVEITESDKTGARERRSGRTRSKWSPRRACLRKEPQHPLLGAWWSLMLFLIC